MGLGTSSGPLPGLLLDLHPWSSAAREALQALQMTRLRDCFILLIAICFTLLFRQLTGSTSRKCIDRNEKRSAK